MVVQHNIPAMNANRYFGINNSGLSKSLEKLSSGYAINRAGDNAAGLAVSEKMRSQIAGLTQGVKNAQDGISMVQTYEGALTETDSILQRMKTLADQAANGTYQDDVDRDAIQLEFDQLNDELDQIADTDFNGVIVLNGGQMSDGLKAVDGKFDYENYVRDAKHLTSADVNRIDYQLLDDKSTTKGLTTKADDVWKKWNANWDRADATKSDGPDSVDLTFEYDATLKQWNCIGATNGADSTQVSVTTNTTNGGFTFGDGTNTVANVVIDQTKLQNGDKLTLTVNNPKADRHAPTNAGAEITDHTGFKEGSDAKATTLQSANLSVSFTAANVTDAKMNASIDSIMKALDGATVQQTFVKAAASAAGDLKMTLSDGTTVQAGKITLDDGTNAFVTIAKDKITISAAKADGTKGDDLFVVDGVASDAADDSSGAITWKIALEDSKYDSSTLPNVVVKDVNTAVSKSNSYSQATAPLTYTDHIVLQAGARTKDSVDFTFKYSTGGIGDLKTNMNCSSREDGLGTASLKLTDQKSANYAIDRIDNAINKVSMVRATFGAVQNRLEHKIDNMNVTKENMTSAESRIRDTNMAEEMTNFTKNQILSQASQAMLAQANQLPQGVLQLLG